MSNRDSLSTTNPAGRWNLLLLGRRRGGYLMTCRLFDNRKFSAVLRHLELEREFGFGYFLDGNARTDLHIAHFRFGGPIRRVATHRAFRIDSVARTCELMVGVNLLVGIIAHKGNALPWPHRPGALLVAHNEEPARVPFALFRARDLASGHWAEWFGFSRRVPCADVEVELLELWPRFRCALRRLCLE